VKRVAAALVLGSLALGACSGGDRARPAGGDPAKAEEVRRYQQLASQLYEQGDLRGALREAVRALTIDPARSDLCEGISRIYTEMGRDDEASEFFALAAKKLPDRVTPKRFQGHHEYLLGHWDRAMEIYEEVARLDPSDPVAFSRMGEILQARGSFEEALEKYRRARELDPGSAETAARVVRLLRITGRYDEARTTVDAALAAAPDSADLYHARSQLSSREGDFEAAEADLRRALEADPRHRAAHYDLARLLERTGNSEEARRHEARARRLADFEAGRDAVGREMLRNPKDSSLPLAFGELELTEDNFREALGWLERARARGAAGPRLWGALAEARFGMGDLRGGEEALRELRGTSDPHVELARAAALVASGRLDEAVPHLDLAASGAPPRREFLYRVADLLREAGREPSAERVEQRCATLPAVVDAIGRTHRAG